MQFYFNLLLILLFVFLFIDFRYHGLSLLCFTADQLCGVLLYLGIIINVSGWA